MQIRMLKNLITTLLVIFILSSCTSDYIVPEPPEPPANPNDTTPQSIISYAGEIQPIWTAKCMPCHAQGSALPTLATGKSYQSLMSIPGMVDTITPVNSALYKSMIAGGSMVNYCKKADADSVKKWISQGAKNN